MIGPCVRALKQDRPGVVVLVESRSARLHRYARGRLAPLEELSAAPDDASRPQRVAGPGKQGAAAARGVVDTAVARRRRLTAFRRLAAAAAQLVEQASAGDRAAAGTRAVERALATGAVDLLLPPRAFVRA